MSGYCDEAAGHPYHGPYHDTEYGFPIRDDDKLFGRLVLEINQAGLSWLTILKKKEALEIAYDGFRIIKVSAYGNAERARLLEDAGIIRNRLKVDAAIFNAKAILSLQHEYGSFSAWLDANHPMQLETWVKQFRAIFTFTGPQIVREFLVSTGYLPDAHRKTCPIYAQISALTPPWMTVKPGSML